MDSIPSAGGIGFLWKTCYIPSWFLGFFPRQREVNSLN
jgi:hypothetical protein